MYVNVDSPNLGFPYFNFLGGTSEKTPKFSYDEKILKGEEALLAPTSS